MKFISCEIQNEKLADYSRLLAAFRTSIQENCPNDELEVVELNPRNYPGTYHIKTSYVGNSVKLAYWAQKVETETQNLCLIDGDTVVLKDMNHVFDYDFDIAFTVRSAGERLPINGGVLFIRPSNKVSQFMKQWSEINNKMLIDLKFHMEWYRIYNGINQASFGYMLNENIKKNGSGLKIIEVPCEKYNACDPQNWRAINDNTHVVHIKSDLRIACLKNIFIKDYSTAINIWNKYATR